MKTLALFLTYGTSLADWERNGSLDREENIYARLAPDFDMVYLLTYGPDDARYADRFPGNVVILPKKIGIPNAPYSLLIPFLYRKELRSCDWLKTNQMLGSWSAVLAKRLYGKKLLLRTGYTESLSSIGKDFFKRRMVDLIERIAYRNADISIVTSEHQKEYITKRYRAHDIRVIPNGIDTMLFRPLDRKTAKEKLTFLFVGRLHLEKNLLALLEAMKDIPDIRLRIVGKGPLEKDVRISAERNGIDLELIPSVPNTELPAIYNDADIYIQPSLYEGNPKTILEAMSCGLPIIATDVPGINSVIRHGKNGYLCGTDPQSIREAITNARNDRSTMKQIGLNARTCIENLYELKKIMAAELDLYYR